MLPAMFGRKRWLALTEAVQAVAAASRETAAEVRELNRLLRRAMRPPRPGFLSLVVTSENHMLQYKVVLPPPSASDVVTRRLSINGQVTDLPGSSSESPIFEGNDNDALTLSLVDIDDAGNLSPPREQSFVLTDTIAPGQPGELGVVVVGET